MLTRSLSHVSHPLLLKSSSTSSLPSLMGTINDPQMTELLSSVSTMLHCQMMRDTESPEGVGQEGKSSSPSSSPPSTPNNLSMFEEEFYTGQKVLDIPQVKQIYQFLKNVFEVGQFNGECCVISLVYINRLIGVTGIPLTQSNWKPITISALVLAQKVWDDTPLINADFSILYNVLSVKQINALERKFLDLLEFKLVVSPSLYAQYYYELRSICEENSHNFKPPSDQLLTKVEQKTHYSEEYQKDKYNYKKKTMTVEDIQNKNIKQIIS